MLISSDPTAKHHATPAQSRAQFSMWAVLAAPLFISTSIADLTAWDLATYSNAEVIAVDQDPLGHQGEALFYEEPLGQRLVLGRALQDESLAAVFVNNFPSLPHDTLQQHLVTCDAACWSASAVPSHWTPGTRLAVRDLWTHGPALEAVAIVGEPYSVLLDDSGGSAMFKFTLEGETVSSTT